MKILSINAGSSSLKFSLIKYPEEKLLAKGVFEKISLPDSCYKIKYNGIEFFLEKYFKSHKEAISELIEKLVDLKIIENLNEIKAVGHRVVHGGEKYNASVKVDDDVLREIEINSSLAPLHNPANLEGIKSFIEILPNVMHVAVFDTSFHQSMKEEKYLYPISKEFYTKYKIRKYGFHGTSHKYVYKTISEYLNNKDLKAIICHLGNGSSLTAVDAGRVIDTSMGFTPNSGVVMGTRSGDIEAGVIEYLVNQGLSVEEVMDVLNKKSGLLGVSGLSFDLRDIERDMDKNPDARLAFDMCSGKIANYIAVYNNLLNKADVICFTAGIGENSPLMREVIIEKIKSLNAVLDKDKNKDLKGKFEKISTKESQIEIYVVPTDEELMISIDTYNILKNGGDEN